MRPIVAVRSVAAILVMSLGLAGSVRAAPPDADLALVLAVDVSRSMDMDELRLQRDGYAAAFRHPDVLAAIADGATGRIAVTFVQWAGPEYQTIVVPWHVIASRADAEDFAAKISAAPLEHEMGTSISSGLLFAAGQFEASGVNPLRRTVDVSGDGPNNAGVPVLGARDLVVRQGITINGLPILLKARSGFDPFGVADLGDYYRDCVIGGPGAFMVTVDDSQGFEVAIRRKLVLEISGLPARVVPAADAESGQSGGTDCMIGEKRRRDWMFDPH